MQPILSLSLYDVLKEIIDRPSYVRNSTQTRKFMWTMKHWHTSTFSLITNVFSVYGQVFYWTHLSYIWVWALLIVHCANFWKWFVAPGVLFLVEKLVGMAVSRMAALYIGEVNLLPSKVPTKAKS